MTTKSQANNNVIYSVQPRVTRIDAANETPVNARRGGTGGGPNNYGQGRSGPVAGSYTLADLMQWRAGKGTSQDRHSTTRLPGEY